MTKSEMKAVLEEVWKEIFQLETVDDDMDFFELGGDSLKAVQLKDELSKKGLSIDEIEVFSKSRLGDMIDILKEADKDKEEQADMKQSEDKDDKKPAALTHPEKEGPENMAKAPVSVSAQTCGAVSTGQIIKELAMENQIRRILDILDNCRDLKEAKEKVKELLIQRM